MSKNDPVAITSLKLKIGSLDFDMTIEEAKKLKESLDEIFPAVVDPVQIHWNHQPYHVPNTPYSKSWAFGPVYTNDDGDCSSATLSIEAEGNIIT